MRSSWGFNIKLWESRKVCAIIIYGILAVSIGGFDY